MSFRKRIYKAIYKQEAFSLMESLLAAVILAFIGIVVLSAIDTNSKSTGILDERVTGTQIATACIEQLRNSDYAMSYSDITENIILPDYYSFNLLVECVADTSGETFGTCSGEETLQRITIQVFHSEKMVFSTCTFKSE